MNQRLQKIYDDISSQNREDFLHNQVIPDTNWGKIIYGATLQIDLSDSVKNQIQIYQKDLSQLEPDNLLLSPRTFQHISFNQVVYWNDQYAKGCQKTWDEIASRFIEKFQSLNLKFDSFPITFFRLIAHTSALIWCASDENNEMETLRNQLLKILPFPQETLKRNHIIHTSIARLKWPRLSTQ